jgi:Tfp pilus assembly protein FimV
MAIPATEPEPAPQAARPKRKPRPRRLRVVRPTAPPEGWRAEFAAWLAEAVKPGGELYDPGQDWRPPTGEGKSDG